MISERRSVARTRVRRNAEIVVGRRASAAAATVPCTLRDLTNLGACLSIAGGERVPDTFELTLDRGRSVRPCRVRWRTADRLGVSFDLE
jgi:hypothetical protein